MEIKTTDVAARLGVSPKTIQRWVRKYDIPLRKNEAGHYLFDEKTIALLERVKFEQSATLERPAAARHPSATASLPTDNQPKQEATSPTLAVLRQPSLEPEIARISSRLNQLEQQLGQKADDVVSVQLLHHRREMEEITARLAALEQLVARLEQQLNNKPPSSHEPPQPPKRKRRGLGRVIGLFA
ncbi:MerR family transcriptional regulator [Caldibacillus thermoamylovorans]